MEAAIATHHLNAIVFLSSLAMISTESLVVPRFAILAITRFPLGFVPEVGDVLPDWRLLSPLLPGIAVLAESISDHRHCISTTRPCL